MCGVENLGEAVALNLIWGEHWRKPGGESGGGAANEE